MGCTPVGTVIPVVWLHLDVLAQRCEAQLLGGHNVIAERIFIGRCVEAVGPEALSHQNNTNEPIS